MDEMVTHRDEVRQFESGPQFAPGPRRSANAKAVTHDHVALDHSKAMSNESFGVWRPLWARDSDVHLWCFLEGPRQRTPEYKRSGLVAEERLRR